MKIPPYLFFIHSKCKAVSLCTIFFLCFSNAYSQEYEIESISQVMPHLKQHSPNETIICLDWDNTVTKKDGDDTEFREPETKSIIQSMQSSGYDILVITSRFSGTSIDSLLPKATRPESIKALNTYIFEMDKHFQLLTTQKTLKSLSPETGAVLVDLEINNKFNDYMILTNNVIFAGSHDSKVSNKGPTLAKLLDLNKEGSQSDEPEDGPIFSSDRVHKNILFIDNDPDHLASVKTAFQKREEEVVLFYYPQDEGD